MEVAQLLRLKGVDALAATSVLFFLMIRLIFVCNKGRTKRYMEVPEKKNCHLLWPLEMNSSRMCLLSGTLYVSKQRKQKIKKSKKNLNKAKTREERNNVSESIHIRKDRKEGWSS